MKRTALRWTAAASVIVAFSTQGARRPRYGGELRIEMRASENPFQDAVFETLVRLDDRGEPQPWLATSWSHDTGRKVWVFTPRANVVMHNGAVWSPGAIEYPDDKPIEEFSRAKYAVRAGDAGTGPFRIAKTEPLTLAAHDAYWGGRPYLDSVEIRMGREQTDQAADFQLGKADVIDGLLNAKRLPGASTELIALVFDARVPDAVREAVALSIDRAAIHGVILQKLGEPAAALLPQWLSGYAFLFPTERKIVRGAQAAIGFAYDAKDPVLRPVAQRIEVNAREAGIILRPSGADVRLARIPIVSRNPMAALEDLGAALTIPVTGVTPFETERAMLAGYRVVPIVHVPKLLTISPRVRNWARLADVWIE